MPFYDLRCTSCGKEWNIMATIADKTAGVVPCPDCGKMGLETVYNAAPYVLKSAGTAPPACPNSHVCGAGCQHAHRA